MVRANARLGAGINRRRAVIENKGRMGATFSVRAIVIRLPSGPPTGARATLAHNGFISTGSVAIIDQVAPKALALRSVQVGAQGAHMRCCFSSWS